MNLLRARLTPTLLLAALVFTAPVPGSRDAAREVEQLERDLVAFREAVAIPGQ